MSGEFSSGRKHSRKTDTSASGVSHEVLTALRNGDHRAYDIVYLSYKDSLELFLTKLTGSHEDAREILQQIFIILWHRRESIDPTGNIKGYLFTIAKNTTLKFFEQRKRFRELTPFDDSLHLAENASADDAIIAEDTRLLLEIAVNNLPRQRREVYKLSFEGLSYDEIAARLDITPANARKHLSLARKQLSEVLRLILVCLIP